MKVSIFEVRVLFCFENQGKIEQHTWSVTLLLSGSPPRRSNWTNPKIMALQGNCINPQVTPLITLSVVGYPTSMLVLKYSVEFILPWSVSYQTQTEKVSNLAKRSKESNWGLSYHQVWYECQAWNIPHLKMRLGGGICT